VKKTGSTRHVRGILDGLLRKLEQGTVRKGNAVRTAWAAATEKKTKTHTRPISLKNGTLLILVENSSWLYKLTLEKKNTLEKFNKHYTGRKKVTDIRFRIGTLEE